MAYKDEFEVARLHADPAFLAQARREFKHGYTVKYNLAPPMIAKRDPLTGELQKRQFGPWMLSAFRMLAKFKGMRGGALDIFSKTEERRHERQLIVDYINMVDEICDEAVAREPRRGGPTGARSRRDSRLRPRQGAQPEGGEGPRNAPAAGVPRAAARCRCVQVA